MPDLTAFPTWIGSDRYLEDFEALICIGRQ
jgi:hypothetical protein